MKKFIKVVGIIAILGSLGVASTELSTIGVSENQIEDITTVQFCDPITELLGYCRSSEALPQN